VTRVAVFLLHAVEQDGDIVGVDEGKVFALGVWHRKREVRECHAFLVREV
jgi:hypothetical protein